MTWLNEHVCKQWQVLLLNFYWSCKIVLHVYYFTCQSIIRNTKMVLMALTVKKYWKWFNIYFLFKKTFVFGLTTIQ